MTALETLQNHLEPGRLYRRSDLEKYSNAVDRHVKQLQKNGVLKKLSGGLYYFPRMTKFGAAPPTDQELVKGFLKDDRFLLFSQSAYNTLGLGTTQLYNETLVYNHKRHGAFTLGNRTFKFVIKKHLPTKLSKEFLLIDLVNNEKYLQEGPDVINKAKDLAKKLNQQKLKELLNDLDWKHAKLVLEDSLVPNDEKLVIHLANTGYQFNCTEPKMYKDISFA